MSDKNTRIEALDLLSKQDKEYYDKMKKRNLERAKRTMASQDSEKDLEEKMELDERIRQMDPESDMSEEELEEEAQKNFEKRRRELGLSKRGKLWVLLM